MRDFQTKTHKRIKRLGFKFFREIARKAKNEDYDYIVLTTRRCFCFFSSIENAKNFTKKIWCFFNHKATNRIKKTVISSQKVDLIGADFAGKTVLLVDDIMIHGQAVYNIYERIKNYNAKDIDTFVLIRNIEAPDYYYFKTKKDYNYIHGYANFDWKEISNSIVSYLHKSSQLYLSFIYGFKVSKNDLKIFIKDNENSLIKPEIDYSNIVFYNSYESENLPQYYFYKFNNPHSSIKYVAFRIYPSAHNKNSAHIVPYIELADMPIVVLNKIWDKLVKKLKTVNSFSDKMLKTTCEEQYKIITAIASYDFFKHVFKGKYTETKEIDRSYIDNFISEIDNCIDFNVIEFIEDCYNAHNFSIKDLTPNERISKKLSETKDSGNVYEVLKRFFYTVSELEEDIYKDLISKGIKEGHLVTDNISLSSYRKPLPTSSLYNKFINYEKYEMYAILLFLLDNGVCSYVIESFDNVVYTAIKVGEQSYHLFADLCKCSSKAVYFLISYFNDKIKKENFNFNFLELFIEQFESEYKSYSSEEKKLVGDLESIKHVILSPSKDFSANYFGLLDRANCILKPEEKEMEKRIMNTFCKIMRNIVEQRILSHDN